MSEQMLERPTDADAPADLDAFRAEARAWLEAHFPPALKNRLSPTSTEAATRLSPEQDAWRRAIGEKGWGTPTWPSRYGGGGLSPAQARVVQQEMARLGAYNPIGGMGVLMFGPTLLEYGTEAQKREHIPPIVRGETWWCQGFSEPGAGSDLASLQCRAEDKGDHWLVNGQKVWTSGAQYADWCFCLVRTDPTKKHAGISFLIFDMKTPGIEVRPIQLISGNSPFCETFLTDVKVPKANLVGPLNGGWEIAKRLLQHERSSISTLPGAGGGATPGPTLPELAKRYAGVDQAGRIADADLRMRIVRNEMDSRAFQLTAQRTALEAKSNTGPSAASSIMKNAGTQVGQVRAELTLEILGQQGLGWDGEAFTEAELAAVRGWLAGKATTIYGGSQEVQNNIVSKRILGLPDRTQA
ncbi:MAG: acyl-CoA dehydrogenase [Phenylobacterium sp.]|nr:acyl-CoA dehydrogenase [Phenylobacterium sp.]